MITEKVGGYGFDHLSSPRRLLYGVGGEPNADASYRSSILDYPAFQLSLAYGTPVNTSSFYLVFYLSHLSSSGITLVYTIAIIMATFVGGCTVAAHYFAGFNLRESSTIGLSMSCKG